MPKGRLLTFDTKKSSIVAHSKCLQFSANLFQEEDASWDTKLVEKELGRISKLHCGTCKKRGMKPWGGAGCGCAYSRFA